MKTLAKSRNRTKRSQFPTLLAGGHAARESWPTFWDGGSGANKSEDEKGAAWHLARHWVRFRTKPECVRKEAGKPKCDPSIKLSPDSPLRRRGAQKGNTSCPANSWAVRHCRCGSDHDGRVRTITDIQATCGSIMSVVIDDVFADRGYYLKGWTQISPEAVAASRPMVS